MRIKAIVCEVLYREFAECAARSRNIIDLDFVTQGLHDLESGAMCRRLQKEVDETDPERYDAVVLGYALCSNGIVGLKAGKIPVVVPRAHDCITLLLGSRRTYEKVHGENPGTYFLSSGWCERDSSNLEKVENGVMASLGINKTYEEYVKKYGEENAKYIMETLEGGLQHYNRFLFISFGLGPEDELIAASRERASEKGWVLDIVAGDLGLIRRLCDGEWEDDEFLILRPGEEIVPSYDERVIKKME